MGVIGVQCHGVTYLFETFFDYICVIPAFVGNLIFRCGDRKS